MNDPRNPEDTRNIVSRRYGEIARRPGNCCCGGGGCGDPIQLSKSVGYDDDDLAAVPGDANLGLGCGNPTAIDALRPGETVLDLGSGAGMDAFLAARQVGPGGRVIGVDMTDDMLETARRNAEQGGYVNVEFRKGLIEALPVEDASVDVIISNCVINLSPEKAKVFAEARRVLKPGGRLMVSDIVLDRALPEALRRDVTALVGCVAGADLREDYLARIRAAGFEELTVTGENDFGRHAEVAEPLLRELQETAGLSREALVDCLGAVMSLSVLAR